MAQRPAILPDDQVPAGAIKARVDNGWITLDGETVTLRPTLGAAQAISRREGGIMNTVQAIARFDLD